MKKVNETLIKKERPLKVVQFGEGNFLRAFVEEMIDTANEQGCFDGSVAIVKAIPLGSLERFKVQDNIYTVVLRGKANGETVNEKRIVTCVKESLDAYEDYNRYAALAKVESLEFIVSNTTEAGIVYDETDQFEAMPPCTYPGKLTKFLYERYTHFRGDKAKGLKILPVELIEKNGEKLKECVLRLSAKWQLEPAFIAWVKEANIFCNTLVDRIVTGYPGKEAAALCETLGYEDELLDVAEPFGLWVIESEKDISESFPLHEAGCPVIFTNHLKPYRDRKVRVLNGAHTGTVLAGYLAGEDIVRGCMEDTLIRGYMESLLEEIMPTVDLPQEEVKAFKEAVVERFENPFIDHSLLAISLNSVSKWKARNLVSFHDYYQAKGEIPKYLTFSFAALMAFYQGTQIVSGALIGKRGEETYKIIDDASVLTFFQTRVGQIETAELVEDFGKEKAFWGEDLTLYPQFTRKVTAYLNQIQSEGMRQTLEKLMER